MKNLKKNSLVVGCLLCLLVGGMVNIGRAESVTARENLEKLKKTNSCKGCDLSGLTLNRMNLAGADLEGADFSMTQFFLTSLAGANLRNANLKGASFGGTDLGEADLRGADLRGTSLDGAYLGGTLLDGEFITAKPYEDLGVTDVEKQIYIDDPGKPKKSPETREVKVAARRDFEEPPPTLAGESKKASLESDEVTAEAKKESSLAVDEHRPDAPVAKKVVHVQQAIVDPQRAQVEVEPEKVKETVVAEGKSPEGASKGAMQSPAPKKISGAPKPAAIVSDKERDISTTQPAEEKNRRDNLARLLEKDSCYGCDLAGSTLPGRNLKNVDLEQADLSNCNLENANLDKANLKGAILRNANLRNASLKNADFYKADLSGADFTGADVQGAMFDNAQTGSVIGLTRPVSSKK